MAKIETKVTAASAMTFAVGAAVAVLNAVAADSTLLGPLPAWAQAIVLPLVPTALTFLAGYQAKHSPRRPTGA
ncbi:holin [Streptomyces sp. NPDC056661]|uniref:holin n=1 Tax=Streptomyces sp. NPDC056661 TaxID=3345898 RepID=UPI00368C3A04